MKTNLIPLSIRKKRGLEQYKAALLNLTKHIKAKHIIILFISFLVGRASLAGGLMPFGFPLFAVSIGTGFHSPALAAAVLAGMASAGAGNAVLTTAASMLLLGLISIALKIKSEQSNNYRFAVIGFFSILVPQLGFILIRGILLFDVMTALFQGFIVFTLIFILGKSQRFFSPGMSFPVPSNEEVISVAIITSIALSGISGMVILGFDICSVLSILSVLIFSFKYGPGAGTTAGITIGLITGFSWGSIPLAISTYAFCGLISGILTKLGKIGAGLGFLMANALLTLYLNGSTVELINLKDMVFALLVFVLFPGSILERVSRVFNTGGRIVDTNYNARVKELTVEKLDRFSRVFKEMSRTFKEIAKTNMETNKQDISMLFDRIADKVCKDCSLLRHCWDRNFHSTYQAMFKVIESLDGTGRITKDDIPASFLRKCERIGDFVQQANNTYELFKVDAMWKNKIGESRALVSHQLESLSDILSNLAVDVGIDAVFNKEAEELIMDQTSKEGLKIKEVSVYENKRGKYEIDIVHKGCGGSRTCKSNIEKQISSIVGRKMVKNESKCISAGVKGECKLKLVEKEAFRVTTGIAALPKHENKVSGDSHTFMNIGNTRYIAAISDGMGSGREALLHSKATVDLIEQFMEAGFDKDITVKLINSILLLKSSEENFSTIDLVVVDLYSGETEFVKIGAPPTFIKKNNNTECVKSVTLPAGIVDIIEPELLSKTIESGNILIMASDGVSDAFGADSIEGHKKLMEYIESIDSINPQHISDSILKEGCKRCGGRLNDDMTIICAKIWKRV